MRTRLRVWCSLISLLVGGCARAPESASALQWEPCRIDGLAEAIRCTTLAVPEDRSSIAGRQISIRIAVVPALARVAEPDPLVLLAGGPGQAATSHGPLIESVLARVRRAATICFRRSRSRCGGRCRGFAASARCAPSSSASPTIAR